MKAIEYTNKVSRNILHLLYSTCTNDLVIQSKQASIIEDFLFAFCIEFNRLFIADSLLINVLKKQLIAKMKMNFTEAITLCKNNIIENTSVVLEFFNADTKSGVFNTVTMFDRSNIEIFWLPKLFNSFFLNTKETLLLIPIYKNKNWR